MSYPKTTYRMLLFTLVVLLPAPGSLLAQSTTSVQSTTSTQSTQPLWFLSQAGLYGNGEQQPLRYEGEVKPVNLLSFSVGTSAFYDDNVLGTNNPRRDDEAMAFDSRLGLSRKTQRVSFDIDYLPYFLLYRQTNQYDRLNHAGGSNLTFRLGSHFTMGLHDTASYENGVFQSLSGEQITSSTSGGLVLSPAAREFTNASALDLTYQRSTRTSLTVYGTFDRLAFGNNVASGQRFYNSKIAGGGVQYEYLISQHVNLGVLYSYQDSRFQGYTTALGGDSRYVDNSAVLSVAWQATPTVTLSVYGSPHYVESYLYSAGGPNGAGHLYGSGGGMLTKQVKRTALELSGQRSVTNGGGLMTYTTSSVVNIGARQQVVGRWEAQTQVGLARTEALLSQYSGARLDSLRGSLVLQRPILEYLTVRFAYEAEHQLSKGSVPIGATFDRNRLTCGIEYRMKTVQFGR